MVLLDKLWDDVVAGPHPDKGLGMLRRVTTKPSGGGEGDQGMMSKTFQRSLSIPASSSGTTTPMTPTTPTSAKKVDVWRSVFNPGSNLATRAIGADVFDKPQPNSPTVYDWLYSGDTRSNHR